MLKKLQVENIVFLRMHFKFKQSEYHQLKFDIPTI